MAPVWWGKNASADTKFEGARTKRACLAAVASTRTSLVPRPSAAYTAAEQPSPLLQVADCFSRSICLYKMKLWQKMPNRILTIISKEKIPKIYIYKFVIVNLAEHIELR